MDRNATVSVRWLLLAGLVGLAMLAAYLVGNARSAPARADSSSVTRTVTVTGVGHVSVVPDQLGFDLSVNVTRDDLNAALSDSNSTMQQVVDTLKAAGVDDKDVQTTDLSMNPMYTHRRGEPTTFQGYRVSQTVTVVVEDLTKASDIVTAAVGAGGSGVRLNGLRLQVGDPEGSLKPARTDAIEQARAKAEEYADDTGLELGDVIKVSEEADQPYDYDMRYSADAMAAPAGIPIQAGQQDLTASVTVVFELE
jgi:uncharacterized protein